MLIEARLYEPIRKGRVTLAFRSWKRPTVSPGGTLVTAAGLLGIDEVEPIDPSQITPDDAATAGAASLDDLLQWLRTRSDEPDRQVYRIRFHLAGEDPRIALRNDDQLDDAARAAIDERLTGWDRRSPTGPWTRATLDLIAESPGVVAGELAARLGSERDPFKRRVRQLKELGLTESLEVGYRLSPRGEAYRRGWSDDGAPRPPADDQHTPPAPAGGPPT